MLQKRISKNQQLEGSNNADDNNAANNNAILSSSSSSNICSTQLPRAKSAIFLAAPDANANFLLSNPINSVEMKCPEPDDFKISTNLSVAQICMPIGIGGVRKHRKSTTGAAHTREFQQELASFEHICQQQQPLLHQHRRRSSIILNKRASTRQNIESVELGERSMSKMTLDEELYDIIYAFLEVDRDKEDDDEATDAKTTDGKPLTRQNLLNKIREKKEVINKLRCQAWNMNRKRRTLRLAQKYLEQNESKVSKTHLYKEELVKRWRQFLRWLGNIWIYFIPWESRIKRIESQFGSVVSSYFTFLRWVICVNFAITIIIVSLVVVPECIGDAMADHARSNRTASRKKVPDEELPHADELATVWHFDGYLRYSPLFYGFYSNDPFISNHIRYPLPLAYFFGTILVFLYSMIVIPRRIAKNARNSKLSGTKAEQYVFNWKLFTGWDFSIGNFETAANAAMAAVIKLREAINESRSYARKACIPSLWAIRIVTNTVILGMIALSVFCIHAAMQSSGKLDKSSGSLFTKNQVPLLMSTITHIFPMIFDLIGRAEKHHARTALRLHLIRISALYIINYVTLMFSLFEKLDNISRESRREIEEEQAADRRLQMTSISTAERWQWAGETQQQTTRQISNELRNQHFRSRNFTSPRQLGRFFLRALHQESSPIAIQKQTKRETNTNAFVNRNTKNDGRITVEGSSVTVHAQFGPVGVNNPLALMRNSTLPPLLESSPYEARRIGPTPLPVFTPPPIPSTPWLPTFRGQNYGPDWTVIQRERERSRKRPITPTPASANITVKRPIDGLPYAKMSTSTMHTVATGNINVQFGNDAMAQSQKNMPGIVQQHHQSVSFTTTATPTFSISRSDDSSGDTTGDVKNDAVDDEEDESMYDSQICWETMIGQEMVRLVTMDLYITIISIFVIDFLRGIWIRYCSSWWCWDIETTFPEYGEFKVAENVLHICNNQGMVWLGLFFAPLLPVINSVKLIVIMYIRGWACTTCNVPAREIFRASRSSSFFLYILLSALLLCTVPVGYVITVKRPSTLCGPFAGQFNFYSIITDLIEGHLNKKVLRWIKYLTSPGVIFPIILLLILFIFFLFSMVRGLRKANTDLQKQLIHERTEEKRKIFELAGGGTRKKGGSVLPISSTTAAAKAQQQQKSQRKVPAGQHLPEVERKRREPWRLFNNINHKDAAAPSSLCPSDELPSSLNSPVSDGSPNGADATYYTKIAPPFLINKQHSQQFSPNHRGNGIESGGTDFRPSLGSLLEAESSCPQNTEKPNNRSKDFVCDRDEQEFARENTPTISTTPEEIRQPTATMNDADMFPSGVTTSLLGVGTPSIEAPHRISLYSREPKRIGISSLAFPPPLFQQQQQRKSSASPSRNDSTIYGSGGNTNQKIDRSISHNNSDPSTSNVRPFRSAKTLPNKFSEQFVPWPSPEEARKLRAQLKPITGTLLTHQMPSMNIQQTIKTSKELSPSRKIKSVHSSEFMPSQKRQTEPPRRFRITVSPVRKLEIVNQKTDSQETLPQHRLVIKQQVFTGSTSTFDGSYTSGMEHVGRQSFLTAAGRKLNSNNNQREQQQTHKYPQQMLQEAPRIEFGEDDSPRIEQKPTSTKVHRRE